MIGVELVFERPALASSNEINTRRAVLSDMRGAPDGPVSREGVIDGIWPVLMFDGDPLRVVKLATHRRPVSGTPTTTDVPDLVERLDQDRPQALTDDRYPSLAVGSSTTGRDGPPDELGSSNRAPRSSRRAVRSMSERVERVAQ